MPEKSGEDIVFFSSNESKSGECPCCKGKNLDYDAGRLADNFCVTPWTCPCGATGKEVDKLVFEGHDVAADSINSETELPFSDVEFLLITGTYSLAMEDAEKVRLWNDAHIGTDDGGNVVVRCKHCGRYLFTGGNVKTGDGIPYTCAKCNGSFCVNCDTGDSHTVPLCNDCQTTDPHEEPTTCSECGGDDLIFERYRREGHHIFWPWKCNGCGATGDATFVFEGHGHREE